MVQQVRFDDRMNDADALMWHLERDPHLRATITSVWILDRSPDETKLAEKVGQAVRAIPRLVERVRLADATLATPRWERDPDFDLEYHVRRGALPRSASDRALLDTAQLAAMHAFDPGRPLWELLVLDGVHEGRAALVFKLHHSLSDGLGLVHLVSHMVDRSRDASETADDNLPVASRVRRRTGRGLLRLFEQPGAVQWNSLRRAWSTFGSAVEGVAQEPMATLQELTALGSSVGRLLDPNLDPASPLMRHRSSRPRFDTLSVPFRAGKSAAARAGVRLNDVFLSALLGGMHRYHEAYGVHLDALRVSMPINVRPKSEWLEAGNQFVPVRFLAPLGISEPDERMRVVNELVRLQRTEAPLSLLQPIAFVLNRLPGVVAGATLGSMMKSVDLLASNVPGPSSPIYVAGSQVEEIYGFGPLAGAAVNATLFSYAGSLSIGITTDRAAVPDPTRLFACLEAGFQETLGAE